MHSSFAKWHYAFNSFIRLTAPTLIIFCHVDMGFYAFNSLGELHGVFFSCISDYGWTAYLVNCISIYFIDER